MTAVGPRTAAAAANIRRLREACGWSAARLAAEMVRRGVPAAGRQMVVKLEHGRRSYLTIDETFVLAEIFGVSVDQLTTVTACEQCHGCPPAGYACLACGAGGTEESAVGEDRFPAHRD